MKKGSRIPDRRRERRYDEIGALPVLLLMLMWITLAALWLIRMAMGGDA